MNKLDGGPLGDATYHIEALGLVVSEKIFKVFILKIYFYLCNLDMQWTKTI